MGVFLQIALRNLLQARRRTVMLGGALVAVTMLFTLLLALSAGFTDTMVRNATTLSAGHINVSGFFKAKAKDAAPIVTNLKEVREIVEQETPHLRRVIDRHRGWAKLISPTTSIQVGLAGIDIAEEADLANQLDPAPLGDYVDGGGDEIVGDIGELGQPGTALIFAAQAKRLEVVVGDMLTITTETIDGRSNTAEVRIVAVARDVGMMTNWRIFVPKQTILELYQLKTDTTGAIMVYLDDIERAEEVMAHLRAVFIERGYDVMEHDPQPFFMKFERVMGEDWTGQKLDLTIWQDEVRILTWVVTAIDTISLILVTLLVFIIGLGIMNTMWIAVRERTREIGTLRAIGMSKQRILQMFVLEALLLGFFSTLLGAALGAGLGVGLEAAQVYLPSEAIRAILLSDVLHLVVNPINLAQAVLAFTTLTALAALAPALKASRLQPVTAIRHQ